MRRTSTNSLNMTIAFTGMENMIRRLDLLDFQLAYKISRAAIMDGATIFKTELKKELNQGQTTANNREYLGSQPGQSPYRYTGNLWKSVDIKECHLSSRQAYAIIGHQRGRFAQWRGPHAHLMERGARHFNWGRPGERLLPRPYFSISWNRILAAMENAIYWRLCRELM